MAMDWIKNPRVQKILKIAGMCLFGLIVFVISIGYTLPEDRLKSYIESKAADAGLALTIGDLDAGGFGTVSLSEVRIDLPPAVSQGPDGTRIEKPRSLEFDEIKADISIFSTLFGTPAASVTLYQGEGHLGPVDISVNAEGVSVAIKEIVDFPVPRNLPLGPFSLVGVIRSGSGNLAWNREEGLSGSTGRFDLVAENLVAKEPTLNTKQAGSISLTDITMGRVEASVVIDKRSNITALRSGRRGGGAADARVIYFEKFNVDGRDISAMVEGNSIVRLMAGRDMSKSQLTLELAFSISEAFFDKSVRGSDEKPNRFLRTLFEMDPRWKSARSGKYYGLICTGTFGSPTCIPRRPSMRGGDSGGDDNAAGSESSGGVQSRRSPRRTRPAQQRAAVQVDDQQAGTASQPAAGQAEPVRSGDNAAVEGAGTQGEEGVGGQEPTDENAGAGADMGAVRNARNAAGRPMRDMGGARRIGGRLMQDNAGEVMGQAGTGPGVDPRLQEPGEPSEE